MSSDYLEEGFEKELIENDDDLKRKIMNAFENDPFFRWSKENDNLMFNGLSFARKAWRDSSKQTRLAVLDELANRIDNLDCCCNKTKDSIRTLIVQMKKEG